MWARVRGYRCPPIPRRLRGGCKKKRRESLRDPREGAADLAGARTQIPLWRSSRAAPPVKAQLCRAAPKKARAPRHRPVARTLFDLDLKDGDLIRLDHDPLGLRPIVLRDRPNLDTPRRQLVPRQRCLPDLPRPDIDIR